MSLVNQDITHREGKELMKYKGRDGNDGARAPNTNGKYMVPSLQALCAHVLHSNAVKKLDDGVTFYQILRTRLESSSDPDISTVIIKMRKHLCERFDLLIKRYSKDAVEALLGDDDYKTCRKQSDERIEAERKLAAYRLGCTIESEKVEIEKSLDGSFPYKSLIAGMAWPQEVDPTKREQYLSDSEFQRVFGMSKTDFNSKDKIIRARLKKQHSLW